MAYCVAVQAMIVSAADPSAGEFWVSDGGLLHQSMMTWSRFDPRVLSSITLRARSRRKVNTMNASEEERIDNLSPGVEPAGDWQHGDYGVSVRYGFEMILAAQASSPLR